ncbi:phosphate signaling complex protein PhoU [soil metagenome]
MGVPMSQHPDPLDRLEEERRRAGGRVTFRQQLDRCDRMLVEAGTRLATTIQPVTTAFLEADAHAATDATRVDEEIREACRELEESSHVLLAREAPVAGDLRRVVAVLRSVPDVERSSNLLRHVAESLTWIHPPSMPDELRRIIDDLGRVSAEIFAGAVEAWRVHDGLAANDLATRDDQVDLLQKCLLTELYTGRQSVEEAVSLALIARYYERIADHGVEMARLIAYAVTGQRPPDDT